jgi:hypothetical protein
MKMRPGDYACGNNHHHSCHDTGDYVLQGPSETKNHNGNQHQQSGGMVCWPKMVVHFSLHCVAGIHEKIW